MTISETRSTKQDILDFLLKHGQAKAVQLAESLHISPQAVRRHLKDLETEGLIKHQAYQEGKGRPNFFYGLSRAGRDRLPNRHGDFAVSFLDALVETAGEEQVKAVLQKQWQKKAAEYRDHLGDGTLAQRLARLVSLRQAEGYMAEIQPVTEDSQGEFLLMEHHCAIAEVAESFPVVCGNELEMFEAILPDCKVERTQWINEGEHRCGYLIQSQT
ncbi:iron-sulfur cluster biosynthesis transcriptional regulator SufR [[Limnothrix rosea] IAM M-220]|uniref:iron-sulfur cluster biosynthesis transcriptional regulator SufR n=1 Tax=[Limnothrix rosea] IAM M-220 TaxID=454133 RepID=UPI0009650EBD|nr:iron-sulfur cluster biosynthesis transcriptional regulator SufR [[Limnothrix rosea] IAM M-220]OKH16921.1 iron-sulfur cluster biosynthesis transcriptional regulator SufR [[Limnothrix rosea] IAM M-220]